MNIYPADIDAVLLEHAAVGDVATIGIPNAEWGEEVLAVVEFCRARLAGFKCPRRIELVDALPRQDNGRTYKRLLRDRYRDAEI